MAQLGTFLEECCIEDWKSELPVDHLWGAYRRWCAARGLHPIKRGDFELNLSDHGFVRTRRSEGWIWGGIRLYPSEGQHLAH